MIGNDYGLRQFVQHVADNIDGRCAYCYRVRMEGDRPLCRRARL